MRLRLCAILCVLLCAAASPAGPDLSGHVRTYFIAADEVLWDYAPQHTNTMMGMPFDALERNYAVHMNKRIGSRYYKAIYREYTGATFKTLKPRAQADRYLGFVGPIIHAEVGDTIRVVFKNNASRPYRMHPHGVLYEKASEGSAYNDGTSGADKIAGAVPPGHTYTYTWRVPERAGPGPSDGSSVVWLYHSHTNDTRDIEAGLAGAIIVTARGMARADGTPKDVDRQVVTLFEIVNENQSWYFKKNIARFAPAVRSRDMLEQIPADPDGDLALTGLGFADSNFKFAINGYIYANGPRIVMQRGQRVRWYVIDMGNGFNFHTPHWHGNTLLVDNHRTDVMNIAPAQMLTGDMVPDNSGVWLFHCHVSDHMRAGMGTFYQVI